MSQRLSASLLVLALALSLASGGCSSLLHKTSQWKDEDLVWIDRPDGTLSCKPRQPEDLGSVGDSLRDAGVAVVESMHVHDDAIQPQQCAQPTGWLNAYRIPKASLARAEELGFTESKIPKIRGSQATVSGGTEK